MNKLLPILLAILITSCSTDTVDNNRQYNIDLAEDWMDNLFIHSDFASARSQMHSEFTFTYMGITETGGIPYTKDVFINDYLPIVGELLPNGIVLTTTDVIADENGVALMQTGDSEGINGEYDNQYVFTFKMKDGLIHTVEEFNSDLLVATRLYRNELLPLD